MPFGELPPGVVDPIVLPTSSLLSQMLAPLMNWYLNSQKMNGEKRPAPGRLGGLWVKHLTLDFDSGHDLMAHGFEAPNWALRSQRGACLGFSLSPPLSLPLPTHALSLSLKTNGPIFKRNGL